VLPAGAANITAPTRSAWLVERDREARPVHATACRGAGISGAPVDRRAALADDARPMDRGHIARIPCHAAMTAHTIRLMSTLQVLHDSPWLLEVRP
jgi:hypothetical protein